MGAPLASSGAEAVVLLVCTADACSARPPRVLRAARRLLPGLGLELAEELAVGATGYRSYGCTEPDCCPPQGRPLAEVLQSRVAAELVLQGHTVRDGEECLVDDVRPERADPAPGAGRQPGPGPAQTSAELLEHWRSTLAGGGREADLVALLGPALSDRRLRDAVMVTLVPGADPVADALLAGGGGDALDACLRAVPDHELLERGVRLLAAAARVARPGHRAGPLGALAWLAWWSGQGARARLLVGRALADRPDHRLALLVDGLLELAVPPPWVREGIVDDHHPSSTSGW
jgi:hypothetical protein